MMPTRPGRLSGQPIVTVLLCVLMLAIPGGLACGASDGDSYTGYWRIPSEAAIGYRLLEVRSADDSYEVRFDTLSAHPAKIVNSRLRLQEYYYKDSMAAPGLDLEVRDGKGIILMGASPSPAPYALTRLTEQQYRAKLNAMADDELKLSLLGLSEMAQQWSDRRGGPPAVGDMKADSAFGRYVARRIGEWPRNPFTGVKMRAGSEPGDFSYTTDGRSFTLTAGSSSGSPVSP